MVTVCFTGSGAGSGSGAGTACAAFLVADRAAVFLVAVFLVVDRAAVFRPARIRTRTEPPSGCSTSR